MRETEAGAQRRRVMRGRDVLEPARIDVVAIDLTTEAMMCMPPPDPDCWLHPDVEVRPSRIEGQGLLARAAIEPGTVVSRLGGHLVPTRELHRLFAQARQAPDPPYVDTIVVDEDVHLILAPGPNRYGNHACDPNLWWIDAYRLVTRRRIEAGEELTSDYATSTGEDAFTMACMCGSALCRRVITGRDWRRQDLRDRYGDHWVPALLDRIRKDSEGP